MLNGSYMYAPPLFTNYRSHLSISTNSKKIIKRAATKTSKSYISSNFELIDYYQEVTPLRVFIYLGA